MDSSVRLNQLLCITRPTLLIRHYSTLIDNTFTNNIHHTDNSGLIMNDVTGHLPIYIFSLDGVNENDSKTFIYKKINDNQSIKMSDNKLRQEPRNCVINVDYVNIASNYFIKLSMTYYDECFLIQNIYLNNDEENNPWLTAIKNNACKKETLIHSYSQDETEGIKRTYKKQAYSYIEIFQIKITMLISWLNIIILLMICEKSKEELQRVMQLNVLTQYYFKVQLK